MRVPRMLALPSTSFTRALCDISDLHLPVFSEGVINKIRHTGVSVECGFFGAPWIFRRN